MKISKGCGSMNQHWRGQRAQQGEDGGGRTGVKLAIRGQQSRLAMASDKERRRGKPKQWSGGVHVSV
jgi:hypothetical protein